jgi:hypothetical protein
MNLYLRQDASPAVPASLVMPVTVDLDAAMAVAVSVAVAVPEDLNADMNVNVDVDIAGDRDLTRLRSWSGSHVVVRQFYPSV